MEAVSVDDITAALQRALDDADRGLGGQGIEVEEVLLREIAGAADGDVRRALTLLEIAAELATDEGGRISEQTLLQVLADRTRRFDKGGEQFYDQISALHKSVRSSNPDAAVYWLARMLDGGCDPAYLARRLTRMAVEDIGLGRSARAADGDRRLGYLRTPGQPGRRPGLLTRSRSTWPAPPSPMPPTTHTTPRVPTCASTAPPKYRCTCAMHRRS